ncbi:MAG: SigB/SigF/SigG family RNA polymerase sigma factor [Acidimicrobiales bacterium]
MYLRRGRGPEAGPRRALLRPGRQPRPGRGPRAAVHQLRRRHRSGGSADRRRRARPGVALRPGQPDPHRPGQRPRRARRRAVGQRGRGLQPGGLHLAAQGAGGSDRLMSFDPARRDELRRLFAELAVSHDPEIRRRLIEAHLGLAEYLARRFANRGETLDDLVQVSRIALLKAVDRYDPGRGVEFSTYATHTIAGELKRHFRDKGWAVRAPRRMQELYLRLSQTISILSQEKGRSPTIAELAAETRVTEDEVLEAMEAGQAYRFASLDTPGAGDEENEALAARLGEEDREFAGAEDRAILSPLIAELPRRQQAILHLRFFEGLTQSDIASRLGISQMHVSRLLARSLAQLRESAERKSPAR